MLYLSLLLGAAAWAQGPDLQKHLLRVAEEAEAFGRIAPKVIGQERLEQISVLPIGRFQPAGQRVQLEYQRREVLAEYGFGTVKEDGGNLHEMRQVVSVDGKQVKSRTQARETLTAGLAGNNDKLKKKMLKEFETLGLKEATTDFGQILLLFSKRQQDGYVFRPLRNERLGADLLNVYGYEQKGQGPAMTVFEGREAVHHRLKGELWLRASDGVPMRVTLESVRPSTKPSEKGVVFQYRGVVDYAMSGHGALLPVAVSYAELFQGVLVVENRFRYSDFKMFGASSDVKFTPAEDPTEK